MSPSPSSPRRRHRVLGTPPSASAGGHVRSPSSLPRFFGAMHSSLRKRLERVMTTVGEPIYIYGGAVRDTLVGRAYSDLDLVVTGMDLETLEERMRLDGLKVVRGRVNPVLRSPAGGVLVEYVATQEDIESYLSRSDYTINAMAILMAQPLTSSRVTLIDPYGGRVDLRHRLLLPVRSLDEHSLYVQDRPLSVLRGVRLAAELSLDLAPGLQELFPQAVGRFGNLAGAQVGLELQRVLDADVDGRWLRVLYQTGVLADLMRIDPAARLDIDSLAGQGLLPVSSLFDVYPGEELMRAAAVMSRLAWPWWRQREVLLRMPKPSCQMIRMAGQHEWDQDLPAAAMEQYMAVMRRIAQWR